MAMNAIVKTCEIFKDGLPGLLPRGETSPVHTLPFEGAEEVGWAPSEMRCRSFPNASLQTRRADFSAPGFPASSGWSCPWTRSFVSQWSPCVEILVTCPTENQRFSAAGSHNLHPTGFLSALISVEVFERTDVMYLQRLG